MLFWLVLLLPWVLDLLGGRAVLATVFGALVWGLTLVLSWAWTESRDPKLRHKLLILVWISATSWLTYWLLVFNGPRPTYFGDLALRLLTYLHAGLLLAGAGIVLFLLGVSILGLLRERHLQKSSWERRSKKTYLPSLESVMKMSRGALQLAARCWGVGLLLAFVVGLMGWKRAHMESSQPELSWLFDFRILFVSLVWVALIFELRFSRKIHGASLHIVHLAFSILFLFSFTWFVSGQHPALSGPILWFVR